MTPSDRAGSPADPPRLFDTLRGEVVPFEVGSDVSIYTCGITPYQSTHVGHATTFLTYDLLSRRLVDQGRRVRLVRNITDVDDDILRVAREREVNYLDLAAGEMARFDADLDALGLMPAWREPRATSAIPEIRKFIGLILDRGHAYQAEGSVYFDSTSLPEFGELSRLDDEAMLGLSAQRGGRPDDPAKRNPLDFVLWQRSLPGEPAWTSRWGFGRPGWHIECSTLCRREFDTATVDLHGGGVDLVYPHHEAERAQSIACCGAPLARHWMHQAMVHYDGAKMSKSVGNLVFLNDLLAHHEACTVRLALMATHYRTSWEWTPQRLTDAHDRLDRWRTVGPGSAALEPVRAALDDDLDVPTALALIDEAADAGRGVSEAAGLLGVLVS